MLKEYYWSHLLSFEFAAAIKTAKSTMCSGIQDSLRRKREEKTWRTKWNKSVEMKTLVEIGSNFFKKSGFFAYYNSIRLKFLLWSILSENNWNIQNVYKTSTFLGWFFIKEWAWNFGIVLTSIWIKKILDWNYSLRFSWKNILKLWGMANKTTCKISAIWDIIWNSRKSPVNWLICMETHIRRWNFACSLIRPFFTISMCFSMEISNLMEKTTLVLFVQNVFWCLPRLPIRVLSKKKVSIINLLTFWRYN